jgi:hypothetical protein
MMKDERGTMNEKQGVRSQEPEARREQVAERLRALLFFF